MRTLNGLGRGLGLGLASANDSSVQFSAPIVNNTWAGLALRGTTWDDLNTTWNDLEA